MEDFEEDEYLTYHEKNNDFGKKLNDARTSDLFCDYIIRVGDEEIKGRLQKKKLVNLG